MLILYRAATLLSRAMYLPAKIIIQMSGAPGSGKSTLATLLAQSMSGIVINHDVIKSFILENGILFEKSAKMAYDFQWTLAKEMHRGR